MLFKYLVVVEDISIGVIFDSNKQEIRVGGHKKFERFIQATVSTYAGIELDKCLVVVDKSKVRYKAPCIDEQHHNMVEQLTAQSIVVKMVSSLGRLIR